MAESEETGVTVIGEVAAHLSAPVKTGLFKALSALLGGLTAIPTALLKRPAQAIDDITCARSAVSAILARGVAEDALKDPMIMQAAAEIYLPTTIRKARNRVQVAQRGAHHTASADTDGAQAAAPDDDWMNAFVRFAEDASSERLQDMFGRILAGQVVRPGSFSLATLRAVAELDQAIAHDFSLAWEKSVGGAVDYDADFRRGEWFARWKRLAEAGLMAHSDTAQYLPPYQPVINGNGLWAPMVSGGAWLNVHFAAHCAAQWVHIDFTRIGREIGSILAPPDFAANIREAGLRLVQPGVMRVELHSAGKPIELIYAPPA